MNQTGVRFLCADKGGQAIRISFGSPAIFAVLISSVLILLGLSQYPAGDTLTFAGLGGLVVTTVLGLRGFAGRMLASRRRLSSRLLAGLPYVLVGLGVLRAVFPVARCVSVNVYPYRYSVEFPVYFPWGSHLCDTLRPSASITAVQAVILIGVGAWWLWWRRGNIKASQS